MRKTLLVTLEYPPFKGGIARYLSQLINALPKDKIQIATNQDDKESINLENGFNIYRLCLISKSFWLWPKWLLAYKKIKKIVIKEKIEILLISHILPIGTIAWFIKKRLKTPFVIICHGLDILTAKKRWHKKKIMLKILKQSQNIIANSQYTANLIQELSDFSHKLIVITPGTNIYQSSIKLSVEEIKKQLNIKNEKILLTVGRLISRKGHDQVIQTLPQVLKEFPDLKYLIVGDGPNQEYLINLIKELNLTNQVKIIGPVPESHLPSYYQIADIFIMINRRIGEDVEGFGISFLEANAFSKPVIGGRSGGVTEAIIDGKTGWLVDPLNQKEIADKIISLLKNKNLSDLLGQQGKKRVFEDFNWLDRSNQLMKILK